MKTRPPAQSLEAEVVVLGAAMLSRPAALEVFRLEPADFVSPTHRSIFSAMTSLARSARAVDIHTVREELALRGTLDMIGGERYLEDLIQAVPSPEYAEHYCAIVRDRRILRDLETAGNRIARLSDPAVAEALNPSERVREAHRLLLQVGTDQGDSYICAADVDPAAADEVCLVSTGLPRIDRVLDIAPGNLVVVAARPSVGKTWFGLNLIKRAGSGLMVSLEMSEVEIVRRLDMLGAAKSEVYIATRATSPFQIEALARSLDAPVIIVDYLQLMQPGGSAKGRTRNEELAEVSRTLKRLAVEQRVPIVAICQLNRAGVGRPGIHHIRDSGAIEADADAVLLIYDGDGSKVCELAKNRHGETAKSHCAFDRGRFTEIAIERGAIAISFEEFEDLFADVWALYRTTTKPPVSTVRAYWRVLQGFTPEYLRAKAEQLMREEERLPLPVKFLS